MIVACHLHVRFEPRKTANSAREALWNRQHLGSRHTVRGNGTGGAASLRFCRFRC
jgi:hypothetical protein